jgi:5'-nucleotidase
MQKRAFPHKLCISLWKTPPRRGITMENFVSLRTLHKLWAGKAAGLALACLILFASCGAVDSSAAAGAPAGEPRPNILISNDDGIDAPGIVALVREISKFASVTVAAPSQSASGASHSKTSGDPIFTTEAVKDGVRWYGIRATPATCVRLALESLLEKKPDFVLSGINRGENLGVITFYSATLGSAREAALSGITAVALNLESGPNMDYSAAAEFAAALVQMLEKNPIKKGLFLNVNVPALPKDKLKGVLAVPIDLQPPYERFEKGTAPDGRTYYRNTYRPLVAGTEKTDVWAVRNGFISVSPLSIDQTDRAALASLEALKLEDWKK